MQPKTEATAGLSDARRALLQKYLRSDHNLTRNKRTSTIPKRSPTDSIPLSYSQQQIWIHSQLAGAPAIYNEPVTIHYSGPLDIASLERSFTEIVRRHEAW